jgi:hypothetical protein
MDYNSRVAGPQSALPARGDLLNALLDIKGAVHISRRTLYDTMNQATLQENPRESAAAISAAESTLTLTEAAIERLYGQLESGGVLPELDEVSHG